MVSEEDVVAIRAFIPKELRNDFKAACAKEGRSMSEVLSEFIELYVSQRNKNPPASKGEGG